MKQRTDVMEPFVNKHSRTINIEGWRNTTELYTLRKLIWVKLKEASQKWIQKEDLPYIYVEDIHDGKH